MSKPQILIVSPHRDDAAFSCGILMCACLASADITIVNIFTSSSYAPFSPQVEREGVEQVSELRLAEDHNMMAILQSRLPANDNTGHVSEVSLGLLDAPLRLDVDLDRVQGRTLAAPEFEDEVSSLTRVLSPVLEEASCVLLPLGLGGAGLDGHIDHRIARDAGLRCSPSERVAFYEDQPYAARMAPLQRSTAVSTFLPKLHRQHNVTYPDGVSIKKSLAGQYSSQVNTETIGEMCNYARERDGGEIVYASASVRSLLETALQQELPSIGAR